MVKVPQRVGRSRQVSTRRRTFDIRRADGAFLLTGATTCAHAMASSVMTSNEETHRAP
jgi:hypothetical protein